MYHYSARTLEKLACNSPLGNGRLLIQGNLPSDGQPKLSVQLDKIPAQAILDALRTVRHEVGVGLEAGGTLSGKLEYDSSLPLAPPLPVKPGHHGKLAANKLPIAPGPLTGSISIDSLRLSGGTSDRSDSNSEGSAGTRAHG